MTITDRVVEAVALALIVVGMALLVLAPAQHHVFRVPAAGGWVYGQCHGYGGGVCFVPDPATATAR